MGKKKCRGMDDRKRGRVMKNATSINESSTTRLDSDHPTPTKGPTKVEEYLALLLTRHETTTYNANPAYGDSL